MGVNMGKGKPFIGIRSLLILPSRAVRLLLMYITDYWDGGLYQ